MTAIVIVIATAIEGDEEMMIVEVQLLLFT